MIRSGVHDWKLQYLPGSESDAFKGISVFIGILISLGSSSFVGNLTAGYSLMFRKAFRYGDRIVVDGQEGSSKS